MNAQWQIGVKETWQNSLKNKHYFETKTKAYECVLRTDWRCLPIGVLQVISIRPIGIAFG